MAAQQQQCKGVGAGFSAAAWIPASLGLLPLAALPGAGEPEPPRIRLSLLSGDRPIPFEWKVTPCHGISEQEPVPAPQELF